MVTIQLQHVLAESIMARFYIAQTINIHTGADLEFFQRWLLNVFYLQKLVLPQLNYEVINLYFWHIANMVVNQCINFRSIFPNSGTQPDLAIFLVHLWKMQIFQSKKANKMFFYWLIFLYQLPTTSLYESSLPKKCGDNPYTFFIINISKNLLICRC